MRASSRCSSSAIVPHLQLQPRLPHPGRRGRPHRGRAHPTAGRQPCLNAHARCQPPTPTPAQPRLLRRRTSTTHPEGRHAARLLALPDERLPDLRVLFATYGVLGRSYAGGPVGRRPVRPAAGGGQHLDAAAVVDHLRLRDAGDAAATSARRRWSGWRSPACSARPSSASSSTSSRT